MFTVVRYSLIRSPSTSALIETTSAPVMPRTVFAASCTAASAAFAKLSGDEPMIVITFATSAISASHGRLPQNPLTVATAPQTDCVICRQQRGEALAPGGPVYETELVWVSHAYDAAQNPEPYLGHLLVEPK